MNFLRIILFPFAIIYGFITSFRNFLFDIGFLKSYSFTVPIIAVGNLSVGGTGKTPQIEYLIRLLSDKYKVATLSRGYKRKSEGFILANENSNSDILGDEPFQFYKKFPNIQVAVDANRKNGIEQLLALNQKPDIILLDDAFQHRKVKADFYIMLTTFNDLFFNDFILPTGNLRESRSGAKRAHIIIVTKCPVNISDVTMNDIKKAILKYNKAASVYFSTIKYDEKVYANNNNLNVLDIKKTEKLLVAGIAKPEPFFEYIKSKKDECLTFSDHHHFTDADILSIQAKAKNEIIITTEKDFVRLNDKLKNDNLYYLPIKSNFVKNEEDFNTQILNFVSSRLP
jgi:tetraacyldisaccharide 4'-kinase